MILLVASLGAFTVLQAVLAILFTSQFQTLSQNISGYRVYKIFGGFIVQNKNELKRRIEEALEIFPALRHKRKAQSGTLSGGQQQMLALARGLMTDPKVLLLDELSLGLAPKIVKEVFAKIKEINDRHKTAIIVVEHNIQSLLEVADRAYVLDKGKVVMADNSGAILKSDILEKVFLAKL